MLIIRSSSLLERGCKSLPVIVRTQTDQTRRDRSVMNACTELTREPQCSDIPISIDHQLRISLPTFQILAKEFDVPIAFINSLLRYQEQIVHHGTRIISPMPNSRIYGKFPGLTFRISRSDIY